MYFQGPILPADVERDLAMVYGDRKWWSMPAMRFLSCVRRRHSVPKLIQPDGIADDLGRSCEGRLNPPQMCQLISMPSCAIKEGLR